ncbi:hypothetical protein [Streptomyces sp. NPDC059783]|uniref:hypothetical protein n=1 Tax=Streptomyces sp. NPDC059783 TaxID=3346944 RepID=UPI00365FF7E3
MSAHDDLYEFATVAFKEFGVPPVIHDTVTKIIDAYRLEVIAERDAQIVMWLEKKAAEEGASNKDSRVRATAIYRMADKLSRGAVRPPLSKGPDSIEYGIRITSNGPDSEVLRYPGDSRSAIEARLARHRTGNPDAHLVQRTVRHGEWTDAATT